MRRINPKDFISAKRGTSREINRQIVLTLISTHQPISRADLARLMDTNRANITFLINELLEENLVREGAQGNEKVRGRKPTFLYLNSRKKFVVAVDIRATRTFLMVTDSLGKQIGEVTSFFTEIEPQNFVKTLSRQIQKITGEPLTAANCQGLGIVVPGMLNPKTSLIAHAPQLGWRDVNLLSFLQKEFDGIEIHLENSGKACALSQIWTTRDEMTFNDLVFVSVSDGVGVGMVLNGELVRGRHNTAGEFGHVPLSIDGPPCSCGSNGCWEAYISNLATLSRYFGRNLVQRQPQPIETAEFSIEDLIKRARSGEDSKALTTLHSTARYLGLGLASIINAIDPSCIYVGGEITEAWDLIEAEVRSAIKERTLTREIGATPIRTVPAIEYPRLRGAIALVTAPAFAAPKVA
jgi:N-acetylglucosamine repressor